jgi:hypothetical protein
MGRCEIMSLGLRFLLLFIRTKVHVVGGGFRRLYIPHRAQLTSMPLESDAFNSSTPLEYAVPSSCLASACTLVV